MRPVLESGSTPSKPKAPAAAAPKSNPAFESYIRELAAPRTEKSVAKLLPPARSSLVRSADLDQVVAKDQVRKLLAQDDKYLLPGKHSVDMTEWFKENPRQAYSGFGKSQPKGSVWSGKDAGFETKSDFWGSAEKNELRKVPVKPERTSFDIEGVPVVQDKTNPQMKVISDKLSEQLVQNQLGRNRTLEALGYDTFAETPKERWKAGRRRREVSLDDLSERQELGALWNEALLEAVEQDLSLQKKYDAKGGVSDASRSIYDKKYNRIFQTKGDAGVIDRGSEVFAPNTLALLDQVGYSSNSGDMDDFLNLRMVIREKDFDTLDQDVKVDPTRDNAEHIQARATLRQDIMRGLADGMGSYAKKSGGDLKSPEFTRTLAQAVASDARGTGAAVQVPADYGFGSSPKERGMQELAEAMWKTSTSPEQLAETLSRIQKDGVLEREGIDPGSLSKFLDSWAIRQSEQGVRDSATGGVLATYAINGDDLRKAVETGLKIKTPSQPQKEK